MMAELIAAKTTHTRLGSPANSFTYALDYVVIDPEAGGYGKAMFSTLLGLMQVRLSDHGGKPGAGRGAAFVREALAQAGLSEETAGKIDLVTQPRVVFAVFNPISFYLCHDRDGRLRAVLAEVTNTYGDRHTYLCARPDRGEITASDEIAAEKLLHVSPFQPMTGHYTFRFDVSAAKIAILITYRTPDGGGLIATLGGERLPLTQGAVLRVLLRRPLASKRVVALIHWQALKLWRLGALFRKRPHYGGGGLS